MSILLKSKMINLRRKELGISREKLSEGICDVTTLARYENGQLDPTNSKLFELLKKLNINSDIYEMMDEEIIENVETLAFTKNINNILDGKSLLSKIKMILPDYDRGKFSINRIFTDQQIYFLNLLAIYFYLQHHNTEAIEILQRLYDYYCNSLELEMETLQKIVYITYAYILGVSGYHTKSITVCNQLINGIEQNTTQNLIYIPIFYLGWNIIEEEKTKDNQNVKNLNKAYHNIEKALFLSEYFDCDKHIRDNMRQYYDNVKNAFNV